MEEHQADSIPAARTVEAFDMSADDFYFLTRDESGAVVLNSRPRRDVPQEKAHHAMTEEDLLWGDYDRFASRAARLGHNYEFNLDKLPNTHADDWFLNIDVDLVLDTIEHEPRAGEALPSEISAMLVAQIERRH